LAPKKKQKKSVCFPPIRLPKTKKKIKSSPRQRLAREKRNAILFNQEYYTKGERKMAVGKNQRRLG